MPDTRGESMVARHADKLQKAKEAAALAKVKDAVPHLPPAVQELALAECGWNPDTALVMLRGFEAAKEEQLEALQQKRQRLLDSLGAGPAGAKADDSKGSSGSESSSGSSSDSDSDSASSDSEPRRKKRRRSRSKGKADKRSSSKHKRSSKRRRTKKDKRKTRKSKDKKAKVKPQPKTAALTGQYGKYGILTDTDMYAKRAEFQLWAGEVAKIDIELMPKMEEKELFRTYMEDYNTATLPHKKYYDLEAYEKRQAAKAAKKGVPVSTEKTAFDDEAERRRELVAQRQEEAAERLRDAYNQLKYTAPDKAADMREQEMMRAQMSLAYRTGDHAKAKQLSERLLPDEELERLRNKRPD